MTDVAVAAAAPILREARARKTPMERTEYVIIISTVLRLVVIPVQPIPTRLAVSFSDPGQLAGMSGLAVVPQGFSLEVWSLLVQHPNVQRGVLNSIHITGTATVSGFL